MTCWFSRGSSTEVAGVAIFRFLSLRLGRRKFAITSPLPGFFHCVGLMGCIDVSNDSQGTGRGQGVLECLRYFLKIEDTVE